MTGARYSPNRQCDCVHGYSMLFSYDLKMRGTAVTIMSKARNERTSLEMLRDPSERGVEIAKVGVIEKIEDVKVDNVGESGEEVFEEYSRR